MLPSKQNTGNLLPKETKIATAIELIPIIPFDLNVDIAM